MTKRETTTKTFLISLSNVIQILFCRRCPRNNHLSNLTGVGDLRGTRVLHKGTCEIVYVHVGGANQLDHHYATHKGTEGLFAFDKSYHDNGLSLFRFIIASQFI